MGSTTISLAAVLNQSTPLRAGLRQANLAQLVPDGFRSLRLSVDETALGRRRRMRDWLGGGQHNHTRLKQFRGYFRASVC
jgi:hypothetical protein